MENILSEAEIQKIEQVKEIANKFNEVGQVCIMYNKGADAEACMERITNIILETLSTPKETD